MLLYIVNKRRRWVFVGFWLSNVWCYNRGLNWLFVILYGGRGDWKKICSQCFGLFYVWYNNQGLNSFFLCLFVILNGYDVALLMVVLRGREKKRLFKENMIIDKIEVFSFLEIWGENIRSWLETKVYIRKRKSLCKILIDCFFFSLYPDQQMNKLEKPRQKRWISPFQSLFYFCE